MTKKQKLANYLLSCTDYEWYDQKEYKTDSNWQITNDLQNLYNRFCYEMPYQKRTTENIKQRLLWLAVSVDYTYFDIANRLEEIWYKKTTDQKYQDIYYRGNMASLIYDAWQ